MHSSPGKFLQARKGCRRIHLWGVNQGGKGLQGRGYVCGSHVTGKEAHSPAGDWSADPRAALPSPCGLVMHPPVAGTVPLLTGRHPEVGTSSCSVRRKGGGGFSEQNLSLVPGLAQSSLLPTHSSTQPCSHGAGPTVGGNLQQSRHHLLHCPGHWTHTPCPPPHAPSQHSHPHHLPFPFTRAWLIFLLPLDGPLCLRGEDGAAPRRPSNSAATCSGPSIQGLCPVPAREKRRWE